MRKKMSKFITTCFLGISLILSGCSETKKYNITVNYGAGGGEYESGETATITADVPEYKEFDYWKKGNEVVSDLNPYSFIVSEDATYTAYFKAQQATVTVVNGYGSGTFNKGSTAIATAGTYLNKTFDYWSVDGNKVSIENPYSFIVTEDVTITAVFKTAQATISVINGTGGGTFDKGTSVTIEATIPEGFAFDYWEVDGNSVSTKNPYTFTVTKDETYTAKFKKNTAEVTVTNGTGSGTYNLGSKATITANEAPQYQEFDYWDCGGKNVSKSNPYTFYVRNDATYTAIYKTKTVNLVVHNGTGSGTYNVNTLVTVTPNASYGEDFDHWEINGETVSSESTYSFTILENTTIVAVNTKADRGVKKTDNSSINLKSIEVSKGGTITIDYKYLNTSVDASKDIAFSLGSDASNCFGEFKISHNSLDKNYAGITFVALDDGYNRLIVTVSKLNVVAQGCSAPTTINKLLINTFNPTKGVYFDVKVEQASESARGFLYTNAGTPIGLPENFVVATGGTFTLDFKYANPTADATNGISLFFGSDETNRFGNYKIFFNSLEKEYNGVTFTALDDGYYRLTVNISKLTNVRSDNVAPTTISQVSFRWFEPNNGVYFDVNPMDKIEKTTEFQMTGSKCVILNFTDIHVDSSQLLSDSGTTGKTIKYGIANSKPDLLVFSGDIAGKAADLDYICDYLDSFKIPYYFILGNHDHEGSLGYNSFAQYISQSKYGYIEKGPEELNSQGNYTVKIKNSEGSLVHGLVMMDTGNKHTVDPADDSLVAYVTNPIQGVKYSSFNSKTTYCYPGNNGLRGNQIEWYGDTVDALNCETTLFCHIPTIDYVKAYEQYQDAINKGDLAKIQECAPIGNCTMGEPCCGSIEDLGLFDKILEKGSTKNVICGHDHLNDFSLMYQGVRLTYGVKTGEGSYWLQDGTRCGYTELTIDSSGHTSLKQLYFNPLNN